MIQITRTAKPDELTDELQRELTAEFKANTKKKVWDKPFIRETLLAMSDSKCCYCECRVGTGTSDMHVEHYWPKMRYKDHVVDWNNLLPSCAHCNRSKSEHDTQQEPIIHPVNDRPQDYFYLKDYRYRCKNKQLDGLARLTLDVLDLNDTQDKVMERFKLGEELSEKIKELYENVIEHADCLQTDTRRRNRIIKGCRDVLRLGLKTAEYSAFMSTIIHGDEEYAEIKRILKDKNVWTDELEFLDNESKRNVFDTHAPVNPQ